MPAERTEPISLPETLAAIVREFPGRDNAGLRKTLRAAALAGLPLGNLAHSIALTACGRAALDEVSRVHRAEWTRKGYDRCYTGPDEWNTPTAYLDQAAP